MAFSKKKVEERKDWLRGFQPGTYLDHKASQISYTDFVNKVGQQLRPEPTHGLHLQGRPTNQPNSFQNQREKLKQNNNRLVLLKDDWLVTRRAYLPPLTIIRTILIKNHSL